MTYRVQVFNGGELSGQFSVVEPPSIRATEQLVANMTLVDRWGAVAMWWIDTDEKCHGYFYKHPGMPWGERFGVSSNA